jgi:dihydroorotase-like cyclic amidohydrolase
VLGVGPIIPDALTASLSPSSSHTAGAAAAHLAALKKQKYSALSATHIVTSKAVETLRLWNEEGLSFFSGLGRHTFLMTLDPRETYRCNTCLRPAIVKFKLSVITVR